MKCNHYGCQSEAEESKKQCRPHLNASKEYQSSRRDKLLAENKCTRCTKPSRPGKTMCQQCADTWNQYLKVRRGNAQKIRAN